MTLYEMTKSANELYNLLCSDEIDEQMFVDTLEAMGTGEKIESCCKVIKELEADADKLKKEIDRLIAKKKVAENGVTRIKESIVAFLKATGKTKDQTELFKVSISTSKSVEIIDESKIPAEYIKPAKVEFDKAAMRKVLMADGQIDGATLKEKEGLTIK